eukprot:9722439-Alexandrium_andersonii.AAC.1
MKLRRERYPTSHTLHSPEALPMSTESDSELRTRYADPTDADEALEEDVGGGELVARQKGGHRPAQRPSKRATK